MQLDKSGIAKTLCETRDRFLKKGETMNSRVTRNRVLDPSMLLLIIMVAAGQAMVIDQGDCGDGWESRPGTDTCYLFIDHDELSGSAAEGECEDRGGFLVSIRDREESNYLQERLVQTNEFIFWIGLAHGDGFGWNWMDGSPFAYTNWAYDQPKGDFDIMAGHLLKIDMSWSLSDSDVGAGAICEKHLEKDGSQILTAPHPQEGQYYECDANWSGYGNNCYFFSRTKKTWSQSREECAAQGADLVTIQNVMENDFIFSELPSDCKDKDPKCGESEMNGNCQTEAFLMGGLCPKTCAFCDSTCTNLAHKPMCDLWSKRGQCETDPDYMWTNCRLSCGCDRAAHEGYWIGFHDQNDVTRYEWADKSVVNFTYWAPTEPNNREDKNEDCVLMHKTTGLWSDQLCDKNSTGFVCQKPKTFKKEKIEDAVAEGCPPGARGYEDKCYTFSKEKATWFEARHACEDNNQSLAIIPNKEIDSFLVSEMFIIDSTRMFWIGLFYDNGNIVWVDGSEAEYTAYMTTDLEDGDCTVSVANEVWTAEDCTGSEYYICQSQRSGFTTAVPTVPSTPGPPASCPAGWTGLEDRCYRVFENKVTWEKASEDCRAFGGSLASIHDSDTNDLLWDTLKVKDLVAESSGLWTGLRSKVKTHEFYWSDGRALTFKAWKKNRPQSEGKYCAGFSTEGEWTVFDCNDRFPYACQVFRGGLFIPRKTIAPVADAPGPDKQDDVQQEPIKPGGIPQELAKSDGDQKQPGTAAKIPAKSDADPKLSTKPDTEDHSSDQVDADHRRDHTKDKDDNERGTVTTSQHQDDESEGTQGSDRISGGAIAGIVVSVLVILALTVTVLVIVKRRWSNSRRLSNLQDDSCSSGHMEFSNNVYSLGHEDRNA